MFEILGKFIIGAVCATLFSFAFSSLLLLILAFVVNLLKLNYYGRDAYWVFSVALYAFLIVWIVSYAYFVTLAEEKSNQKLITDKPARKSLPEPIEYRSIKASGTVESIHIGGRTEVVPVVQVELTRYFHEENLWVLGSPNDGGIVQPEGRKNYFIPVLSGTLNTKWGSAQLFEASNMEDDGGVWSSFRVANIIFEDEKPVSLLFKHYAYENGQWKEVAGYKAFFKEVLVTKRKKPKEVPNISFEEHVKICQQCGKPAITEDGPQSLCEDGFRIFQREVIQKMEKDNGRKEQ